MVLLTSLFSPILLLNNGIKHYFHGLFKYTRPVIVHPKFIMTIIHMMRVWLNLLAIAQCEAGSYIGTKPCPYNVHCTTRAYTIAMKMYAQAPQNVFIQRCFKSAIVSIITQQLTCVYPSHTPGAYTLSMPLHFMLPNYLPWE